MPRTDRHTSLRTRHCSQHLCSAAGRHSVVAPTRDSADAARILPSTSGGFGRSETNGAYRTMILHNCLSGLAARPALREELRQASTPCSRRQAQLGGGWPSSFQDCWSRLHVRYSSPLQYFLTGSSTCSAHTRPLHAPERAGRSSNKQHVRAGGFRPSKSSFN